MNLYRAWLKPLLFKLEPEQAHRLALLSLRLADKFKLLSTAAQEMDAPAELMGLSFPNRIGLAAGFDKNADYVDVLASLGFGFIEIGTVTPLPQAGNLPPRIFRLTEQDGIINRLGFNNKGCDYVVERLKKCRYHGVLGVNIGKNSTTPLDSAVADYVVAFRKLAPFANYITINISSPNTVGLRHLQQQDYLADLLFAIKKEQHLLKKYVPVVVKIAPDILISELSSMVEVFLHTNVDGVIATNTSLSRFNLPRNKHTQQQGGLSGLPLTSQSTYIMSQLHQLLRKKIPIIASGGVMSRQDVLDKVAAGADLVQIYTGLIYHGVSLIKECASVFNSPD